MSLAFSPTRAAAFRAGEMLATGPLAAVALALHGEGVTDAIVLDEATGRTLDLDLRGGREEVAARYAPPPQDEAPAAEPERAGRGRPKLGVVAREVTLLPRHWDWLTSQRGGASVTLRRLIDEARKAAPNAGRQAAAQEAAYRAMSTLAGNRPGFEEASRCLFAGDLAGLAGHAAPWPPAITALILRMAQPSSD
jgi:hypothetical protein